MQGQVLWPAIHPSEFSTVLEHFSEDKLIFGLIDMQAASSDEGGVAAGFAVLDSPSLQD